MNQLRFSLFYRSLITLLAGLGLVLIYLVLLTSLIQPIQAANFDLTGACPAGVGDVNTLITTIRNANNETLNPGPDTIILASGCIYTLTSIGDTIINTFGQTGLPAITSTITISGNGATILRDPTMPNFRLLYVGSTGNLTLQNLTLQNGLAQGGNGFECSGGAAGMGGAIFNDRGNLTLKKVTLLENVAQGGNGPNAPLTVLGGGGGVGGDGSSISGGGPNGGSGNAGEAGGFGGGGSSNSTGGAGGTGGFGGGGGSSFTTGGRGGFGAGGGCAQGIPGSGGGNAGPTHGGGGAGFGGAIFNLTGTVRLTNTTFYSNSARGGTGYQVDGAGSGFGGAIFNLNGNVNIVNSTIVSNSIVDSGDNPLDPIGGSIFSLGDRFVYYTGDSLANLGTTANLTLVNTIIADTVGGSADCAIVSPPGPPGPPIHTSNISGTNNLIENNYGCVTPNSKTGDPKLGPLQNNGGDTKTLALLPGSPALDAGNNALAPTTDQRGLPRASNSTVDLGAFELQVPLVDLALTKVVTPTLAAAGEMITYTLAFSNASEGTATGVIITDIIPISLTNVTFSNTGATITPSGATNFTWQTENLAQNQGGIITITGILSNPLAAGIFTNTATITSATVDIDSLNNRAKVKLTTILPPDLAITKTVVTANSPTQPGDTISYTVVVGNSGGREAIGVRITDTLPALVNGSGLDETVSIMANEQITFTIPATLDNEATYGTTITNTAYYSHTSGQGKATAAFTIGGSPQLAIRKRVTFSNAPPQPGAPLTYTIVLTNTGDSEAVGVTISDTLPKYINGTDLYQIINLAAGKSVTLTLSANLDKDVPLGETITNVASFSHPSGSGLASQAFLVKEAQKNYLPLILKKS